MNELTKYIDGWRRHDISGVLAILAADCVVIECYGPIYESRERVEQWMRAWFEKGGVVDDWHIKDIVETDDFQCAEWTFTYTLEGKQKTFDGATMAKIVDGKIVYLREYATTAPLYEWTGTWRE